jgi:hypothetical protein
VQDIGSCWYASPCSSTYFARRLGKATRFSQAGNTCVPFAAGRGEKQGARHAIQCHNMACKLYSHGHTSASVQP